MNHQPRLWWTFAITSLALFAFTLDRLVVATALPAIRTDLGAQAADLEWTVNAYTLSFAALLLTGGALGDRFGRRRMFTIGVAVFTAGSAAAALAPTIGTLVAARALQGVGGALFTPLTLTMLSAVTPSARRGAVLGAWGGIGGLGAALGPLAGGALAGSAGWRVIFWLNVPLGLALIALGRLRLVESRGPRRNLDLAGVVLGSAGLCSVVWAVIRAGTAGWSSIEVSPVLCGGVTLLVLFVSWEIRTPAPSAADALLPQPGVRGLRAGLPHDVLRAVRRAFPDSSAAADRVRCDTAASGPAHVADGRHAHAARAGGGCHR